MKILLLIFLMLSYASNVFSYDDVKISHSLKEGQAFLYANKYEKALLTFKEALNHARLLDFSEKIATSSYYVALCYFKLGNINDSEKFIKQALFELKDKRSDTLANVSLLKAALEKEKGNLQQAITQAKEVLNIKNVSTDIMMQGYLFIIETLLQENDVKTCEKYLKKAKKIKTKIKNPSLSGWYYHLEGNLYFINGDYNNASSSYIKMATIYKTVKIPYKISSALELAAKSFEKSENFKDAAEYYYRSSRSYFSYNKTKSLLNIKNAQKLLQYAEDDLKAEIAALYEDLHKEE